jgi:hypothetical protein
MSKRYENATAKAKNTGYDPSGKIILDLDDSSFRIPFSN